MAVRVLWILGAFLAAALLAHSFLLSVAWRWFDASAREAVAQGLLSPGWDAEPAVDERAARAVADAAAQGEAARAQLEALRQYQAASTLKGGLLEREPFMRDFYDLRSGRGLLEHDPADFVRKHRAALEASSVRRVPALGLVLAAAPSYELELARLPDHPTIELRGPTGATLWLRDVRELANGLQLEALRLSAEPGSRAAARRVARAALRFTDVLAWSPSLIAEMVRVASLRTGAQTAAWLASRGDLDRATCRAMLDDLRERSDGAFLLRAARGEAEGVVQALVLAARGTTTFSMFTVGPTRWYERALCRLAAPLLLSDGAWYLDRLAAFHGELVRAPDLRARLEAGRRFKTEAPWWRPVAGHVQPNWGRALQRMAEARAQMDLLRLRLALVVVAEETGRRPASLDRIPEELVPAVNRVDPFTGRPYRGALDAQPVRLWSAGPNGVDEGGAGDDLW